MLVISLPPTTTGPRYDRLLIAGNSLAVHPPLPSGGWYGTWGMAASAQELDFAHLLADALGADVYPTYLTYTWERQFSTPDAATLATMRAYDADIVVVRLSDNVRPDEYFSGNYSAAYRSLIVTIRPVGARLICTSSYYDMDVLMPGINAAMQAVCEDEGGTWVELRDIQADSINQVPPEFSIPATPDGAAVANHPNNTGHRHIYERIFDAI